MERSSNRNQGRSSPMAGFNVSNTIFGFVVSVLNSVPPFWFGIFDIFPALMRFSEVGIETNRNSVGNETLFGVLHVELGDEFFVLFFLVEYPVYMDGFGLSRVVLVEVSFVTVDRY